MDKAGAVTQDRERTSRIVCELEVRLQILLDGLAGMLQHLLQWVTCV